MIMGFEEIIPTSKNNCDDEEVWVDECDDTYCEEENKYEIIDEIDLFGNKIKKKVIRSECN